MKRRFIAVVFKALAILCFAAEAAYADLIYNRWEITDYLVLVNKDNPIPEGWEEQLRTYETTNWIKEKYILDHSISTKILQLESHLLVEDGIWTDISSAYRSIADQEDFLNKLTDQYGEEYVKQYEADPGYSEHHTGLALDLFLKVDGKEIYEYEEMMEYPEIWEKIHSRIAEYGFILRYPKGKEDITGFSYQPWHIRYIGDAEAAAEIMAEGITLEEYLLRR